MRRETRVHNLLIANGYTVHRNRVHPIYRCPCGHAQITGSKTGYKGSGDTWITSLMARQLRVCKANLEVEQAA